MKKILLILVLCSSINAQTFKVITKKDFTKQPVEFNLPQTNKTPYCDTKCKLSIAAYVGGAGLDVYSSLGRREANPLWRDSQGMFNATSNSLYKGGILAVTLWQQKYHPDRMSQIRFYGGILFGAVGAINFARAKNSTPIF